MNNQNIIVYVPVLKSVRVDVHEKPFKIPSILKRKRIKPTNAECEAFLNQIIWDDLGIKPSDFFD